MLLSTQTQVLLTRYGLDTLFEICSQVGFKYLDYSFFDIVDEDSLLGGDDYIEVAKKIKSMADSCDIVFNQAHAPFWFDYSKDGMFEYAFSQISKSIEISGILGVSDIIIHPLQYMPYRGNEEKLFEINVDYYRSLIPVCEKNGVRMCTENMFQEDPRRKVLTDSFCARPKEFAAIIDAVDSKWLGGCLDLGHCGLVGTEAQDMIRALGSKYIHALHVHDNDFNRDRHTLPGLGKLNWTEIMRALADIDYKGYLTLECDNFLTHFNTLESSKNATALMYSQAKYLGDMFESFKENKLK